MQELRCWRVQRGRRWLLQIRKQTRLALLQNLGMRQVSSSRKRGALPGHTLADVIFSCIMRWSSSSIIALAGNKSDLNSKRKVEPEVRARDVIASCLKRKHVLLTRVARTSHAQEAESYANDNGIFFMETSAKTATNVNELFVAIGAAPVGTAPRCRVL